MVEKKLNKKELSIKNKTESVIESCKAGIDQIYDNDIVNLASELTEHLIVRHINGKDCEGFWYSQICRSMSSIAANYAEGIGKAQPQDTLKFMLIARGSAYESYVWSKFTYNDKFIRQTRELCNMLDQFIISRLNNGEQIEVE